MLEFFILSRIFVDINIYTFLKLKDKVFSSPVKVLTHVPNFTTISSKYLIIQVLDNEDSVISVLKVMIKGLHGDTIVVNREK